MEDPCSTNTNTTFCALPKPKSKVNKLNSSHIIAQPPLEDSAKGTLINLLPRASRLVAIGIDSRLAMSISWSVSWSRERGGVSCIPESETDKQPLVHLVVSVLHLLQRFLLVMYLLILGHISLTAEVIEVASVGFGV